MSNIVRLPTAAPRQIRQGGRKVQAYRAANPWPGAYKRPVERAAESLTDGLTAAEIVLASLMASMPADARRTAIDHIHHLAFLAPGEATHRASVLVAYLSRVGER